MSGFDPQTLEFYSSEAPVYTASGKDGSFRHLEPFLALLAPGASILELGCGGGYDAAFMIARGFEVDATDGVPEMAAKAQVLLDRPVRTMRFDELDATGRYDAVVASASLLHVPRGDLSDIVERIWRALKPGGWHIASYKGGGVEGRDGFGRYFNYLSQDELAAHYGVAGHWATMEIDGYMGGGYDRKPGPWLTITVQKP
ncbi:MAG: class I SAM-dependent methyltransferase [Sphingopyxis sp.]